MATIPDLASTIGSIDIDQALLDRLVCPVSHAKLVCVGDWLYSTDRGTRRKYPIRDGIPIMLTDESQVVDVEEFDRVMAARPSTSGTHD